MKVLASLATGVMPIAVTSAVTLQGASTCSTVTPLSKTASCQLMAAAPLVPPPRLHSTEAAVSRQRTLAESGEASPLAAWKTKKALVTSASGGSIGQLTAVWPFSIVQL